MTSSSSPCKSSIDPDALLFLRDEMSKDDNTQSLSERQNKDAAVALTPVKWEAEPTSPRSPLNVSMDEQDEHASSSTWEVIEDNCDTEQCHSENDDTMRDAEPMDTDENSFEDDPSEEQMFQHDRPQSAAAPKLSGKPFFKQTTVPKSAFCHITVHFTRNRQPKK